MFSNLFIAAWMFLVVASVAWYGFLVFYIGLKGGKEILEMMVTLDKRNEATSRESEPRN